MKIVFTKHVLKKQEILKELGWNVDLKLVEQAVSRPDYFGKTSQNQPTAIKKLDESHILRVVYEIRNDIITVITFHIARKGRYNPSMK